MASNSAGPSSSSRSGRAPLSSIAGSKRPGQQNLEYMAPSSSSHHTSASGHLNAAATASAAEADKILSGEATAKPVPLRSVVSQAVKRWFNDTLQEAQRGDVKQQALLGQMYAEGYGCEKDVAAAKEWSDRAMARGYRMQGVYCEI